MHLASRPCQHSVILCGMNGASAALVASAISAVVAMLVVTLQNILERRRQALKDRIERLAAFFADAHAIAIAHGSLARASMDEKGKVETQIREQLADRFNLRFAQVRLLEETALVESAIAIDQELVSQAERARASEWSRDEWRRQRARFTDLMGDFESLARQRLRGDQRRTDSTYIFVEGN